TDYIDLYQIHRPQSDIPIDETLRALDDLVRDGKVRYIGTSTFAAWQVLESLWAAKELGLNRFVCEQPPYNIMDRRIERELLPMARTYGIGTIPWSPIGGGLLSGSYTRDNQSPDGKRYSSDGLNAIQARRKNDDIWDVIDGLSTMAADKGITLAQLALAWVAAQPGVTSPIIGPRTMEHLEDNLGALDVTFTDEELATIDELVPPGRMVSPFYEADFGPHQFRW
ncbi:MAG: aldo/keto reductase, partial [Caldilineaceae bacterium]|nr:aldo/keto reductase [Caldilineaceae bacterium]